MPSLPFPPSLHLVGFALAMLCGLPAHAECLAPLPPGRVTDPATRTEYHAEIAAEYSTYFDEAQAYLRCLDETRAATIAEVNAVLADYQTLGIGKTN